MHYPLFNITFPLAIIIKFPIMSDLQPIQVLEEHQDLVQKLLPQINTFLGQSHFSFHINSAEKLVTQHGTEYHFRIKSNDGELYKVVILQPNGSKAAELVEASSLYKTIDITEDHQKRVEAYKNTINLTYKVENSAYTLTQVQQMIDEPSNFIFKVRGAEDKQIYKVKIEKPIVSKVNKSPDIVPSSRISA